MNATETKQTFKTGQTLKIEGRQYTVGQVVDLTKLPNTAKYVAEQYIVLGKRGAAFYLAKRPSGSWFRYGTQGAAELSKPDVVA